MGKLMKAAVLGGIGQAFTGFMEAKEARRQQEILFERQDKQAREQREFTAGQAQIERQARGFFLPGEDRSGYDKMIAEQLQRTELAKRKNDSLDPTKFLINGGARLRGVPESVAGAVPSLDLSAFKTRDERQFARDDAIIKHANKVIGAMRAEDNTLSYRDAYQQLLENNPTFGQSIKDLIYSRHDDAMQKGGSAKDTIGVPLLITGQSLFAASPNLAGVANAAIVEKNEKNMIPAAKELNTGWKISGPSENIAGRALGSVFAQTKTTLGQSLPPRLQKLANDRFANLNDRMINEDISMEEFYGEMKNLMGGTPSELEMRTAFKEASSYFQPAVTARGFLKGSGQGDVNPNFEIVPTTASDRDKLHGRSAAELKSTTVAIAKIASEGNVDVSPASANINRTISTTVTVVAEGLKAITGGAVDLTGQKFVNVGTEEIIGENKEQIRDSLFSELDSTISNIQKDKKIVGLSEEQTVNLSKKLQKFKAGLANSTDDQTYLFNFQRVKLAFLYAKFIQGGGGGNAVSNADFERNFDALFGIYSSNRNVVLADMMRGIGAIHNDAKNSIVDAEDRQKFTANLGGQNRYYISPSAKKLIRNHNNTTGDSLSTPGYQSTARYWINELHKGDVEKASPLLRAMLVSRGQNDLIEILEKDAGGEAGGGGEQIIPDLEAAGGAINQKQDQDLGDSIAPSNTGGSN